MTDPYAHLDDPAERKWLNDLVPLDVLHNAHRMYDFMQDTGMSPDSYTRELAFQKAAAAFHDKGITYDVLYDAWLSEQPVLNQTSTVERLIYDRLLTLAPGDALDIVAHDLAYDILKETS